MNIDYNLLLKYENEFKDLKINDGLYSTLDSKILYAVVREFKPRKILELGARTGKTTSCILNGLIKNNIDGVEYHIFEMDEQFHDSINKLFENTNINYNLQRNILESVIYIENIDFLFIDGNHDYMLAKWYLTNLFPLLKNNSLIHIHDINYDEDGTGWDCVKIEGHTHVDLMSKVRLKELYPTIFDKYNVGSNIKDYEGTVIKKFYNNNKQNLIFFNTCSVSNHNNLDINDYVPSFNTDLNDVVRTHITNCASYFIIKNHKNLKYEVS